VSPAVTVVTDYVGPVGWDLPLPLLVFVVVVVVGVSVDVVCYGSGKRPPLERGNQLPTVS